MPRGRGCALAGYRNLAIVVELFGAGMHGGDLRSVGCICSMRGNRGGCGSWERGDVGGGEDGGVEVCLLEGHLVARWDEGVPFFALKGGYGGFHLIELIC